MVFTILTLLVKEMAGEVMFQPLLRSQLQYCGGEQAGALADNAGQAQQVRTGLPAMNMRVCNDFFSTGGATVTVAGNTPHDLLPGRCAEDIGDQFLVQSHASGQVTIDYRSIQGNQGRRMQDDD